MLVSIDRHTTHDGVSDFRFLQPLHEAAHRFVDLIPGLEEHGDFLEPLPEAKGFGFRPPSGDYTNHAAGLSQDWIKTILVSAGRQTPPAAAADSADREAHGADRVPGRGRWWRLL